MDEKLTKAEEKEIRKEKRQEWEEQLKKQAKLAQYKKFWFWVLGFVICALAIWGLVALSILPNQQRQD